MCLVGHSLDDQRLWRAQKGYPRRAMQKEVRHNRRVLRRARSRSMTTGVLRNRGLRLLGALLELV